MSKKIIKLYSEPNQDPSFLEIQAKWYGKLRKEGFEDQENTERLDRPLKRWSGISSIYIDTFQPPGALVSSFPESAYKEEERFQNHPEFNALCISLCNHGNSRLTPKKVRLIWVDYCDGKTIRESERHYRISDTTIFRVIRKITEWMNLMDTRQTETKADQDIVLITRDYEYKTDAPMLYATWRNALWFDKDERDERRAHEFYSHTTRAIKALLAGPKTKVRIACDKHNPDFIVGYSVMIADHLEFVYVKIDYRKRGIARLLTKGVKTISQPATKIGKRISEKLSLEVKENHETVQ